MPLWYAPTTPLGIKPTPASFLGESSVPGNWWDDMILGWPFWEGVGNPREWFSQKEGSDLTLTSWVQSDAGPSHRISSNGRYGYSDVRANPIGNDLLGRLESNSIFTMMIHWRYIQAAEGGGHLFRLVDGGTLHRIDWLEVSGGNDTVGLSVDTGPLVTTGNAGAFTAGDLVTIVGTYDGARIEQYTWVNGQKRANWNQGANQTGSFSMPNQPNLHISGRNNSALDDYPAEIEQFWMWNRVFEMDEIEAIAADPFAPIRSYAPIVVPAAAEPPAGGVRLYHTMARGTRRGILRGVA